MPLPAAAACWAATRWGNAAALPPIFRSCGLRLARLQHWLRRGGAAMCAEECSAVSQSSQVQARGSQTK